MKTVKYCTSVFEAYLVAGRLANEGIRAEVINEALSDVLPYSLAIPSLSVQVVVADTDYPAARELLCEPAAEKAAARCPHCGSTDVAFGYPSRRRGWIYGLLVPLGLLGAVPDKVRPGWYCRSCGSDFVPGSES